MHDLLPSASLFGDKCGPFKDSNVLLDVDEAHRVALSEMRDRLFVLQHAGEDVPAGRIGKRAEDAIDFVTCEFVQERTIYNHKVVR